MASNIQSSITHHNLIVQHALSHLPDNLRNTIRVQRNYFTAHNTTPESPDFTFPLTEPLITFLSSIDIVLPSQVGNATRHLAFTPFLLGIPPPSSLRPETLEHHDEDENEEFQSEDSDEDSPEPEQKGPYILLYAPPHSDPDALGLILNPVTMEVTYLETIYDDPNSQRLWVDLDTALERYWHCIEMGKFVIDGDGEGSESLQLGDDLAAQGWKEVVGCTEEEMRWTLEVWDELVDAIERRLPASQPPNTNTSASPPTQEGGEETSQPLISPSLLPNTIRLPPFIHTFLTRAHKPSNPNLKHIAPSLLLPTPSQIQHFASLLLPTSPSDPPTFSPPFPLFPWSTPGLTFTSDLDSSIWSPKILDNTAGLYITPSDPLFSHAATLLLPFPLGRNGHVARADGSTIDIGDESHAALYQHGICPFGPGHATPLAAVLKNWVERVESGEWGVDGEGVVGGREAWEGADTEDGGEGFRVDFVCR